MHIIFHYSRVIVKLYYQIVLVRPLKDYWELKYNFFTTPLVIESEQSLSSCKGVKEQIFQNSIEIILHFHQLLKLLVIEHLQILLTVFVKKKLYSFKKCWLWGIRCSEILAWIWWFHIINSRSWCVMVVYSTSPSCSQF